MFEEYLKYQHDMLKRMNSKKFRDLAVAWELGNVETEHDLEVVLQRHRRQKVMREMWKDKNYYDDGYLSFKRISPQVFQIDIQGKPKPLQRPRFSKSGHIWDCQKKDKLLLSEAISNVLRAMESKYIKNNDILDSFFNNPVDMIITFFFEMPQSWSESKKRKRENTAHIQKPDLSNLVKFYEDSMNGIMFKDDSQVYNTVSSKRWSRTSRTEITLSFYDDLEQKNYSS